MNEIVIRGLKIRAHVGVPDEELASAQEIHFDLTITPLVGFGEAGDDLSRTVDYAAVVSSVEEIVRARPRRLIETLAYDVASVVIDHFAAASVTVEIRKFILPQTDWVAVRCSLSRASAAAD
jgi:dihydroneopterin aldolase